MAFNSGGEGMSYHASIWRDDGPKDLNELINSSSGWKLTRATDINGEGQIVGEGAINGETRAFLLTPVGTSSDTTPPTTSAKPDDSDWHNDGTVKLSATDGESGVKEITYSASGAQVIDSTTVPGSSTEVVIRNEGETRITYSAKDNAGNTAAEKTVTLKLDKTPPEIDCDAADTSWHNEDVSISCTASDSGSGLADPADTSFSLSTSVPDGTETENAETNSRTVYDAAGNSATAGPISGNKVDKKPPTATIDSGPSGSGNAT